MKLKKLLLSFSYLCMFAIFIYISGCVNVEQKTTLKDDGSGSMKLHFWTKMSNLSMGDEIGGFSFSEDKVKSDFTSANCTPSDVKVEEKLDDSTKHVNLMVTFKDINKLSEAKGFSKTKQSWTKGKDGMDFKYTLMKDTANAGQMGMNEYKLGYTFEFPGEVTATNGNKDGKTVSWNKTVADLTNDIEMTASVKSGEKKCGLFGMELPAVFLVGMTFMYGYRRRKK